MPSFAPIRARAEARKGGREALMQGLGGPRSRAELIAVGDDRYLAEMTRRVFCTGFSWKVIDAKWPGFEAVFIGFDPAALLFQPDEFWDACASDRRIVRNGAKIASVRDNARFVREISAEHGGFGRFLADWPPSDQMGLLDLIARRGSRLGGRTGQILLRFLGYDAFILSRDVVACLRDAGLEITEEAK
jgi:3-methyladenine DNA glycosylase Tag